MLIRRVATCWVVTIVIIVGLLEVTGCELPEEAVEVRRVIRNIEFLRRRRISAGTNAEEMNAMPF